MGHDAIKLELINWLTKLNDDETLDYLKVVKDACDSKNDWWLDLSDAQKSGIERGLKDIDAGRIHSHNDVKLKYGF
jgi:predicted transcriptional regulator